MATGPQVFRPGVKYIKLAKFDTGSVSSNLTITLGEIKKIRVNYTDKGIVEYPIQTISEHPDYYLYRVATTDATSSADNKQLNYNFISARNPLGLSLGYEKIKNYNFESDPLNYFTPSEGDYLYGDTPNKNLNIQYTASFIPDGGNLEGSISIIKQNNLGITSSLLSQQFQENTNFTISQSININPIEGEKYFSVLNIDTIAGSSPSLDDFKFKILTGSAYTTSNGTQIPTVLEPFFESKFTNGDCDVLLGNATEPRLSTLYFDVDYSTSQISPVNLQAILTGSAVRAQTPDSNYSLARSIRPRYEGSKNTDPVPLQTVIYDPYAGTFISSSGPFDRQLIQSTSSLAPLNNYVSAIVEYEDISISGSDNKLQNERVPNNIIFIESKKPGQAIFQSIQGSTQTSLEEEGKLAIVEGVSDFSTLGKGDPSFFPTIQQIFKEGDSVNLLSYEASSIVASGSIPLVTRTIAGFSSSIETIVFEDKRPFPTALLPTGKGAIFSTFSSPVINRNIIDITKKLGNNGNSVIINPDSPTPGGGNSSDTDPRETL